MAKRRKVIARSLAPVSVLDSIAMAGDLLFEEENTRVRHLDRERGFCEQCAWKRTHACFVDLGCLEWWTSQGNCFYFRAF
jgi:hypothetical protein